MLCGFTLSGTRKLGLEEFGLLPYLIRTVTIADQIPQGDLEIALLHYSWEGPGREPAI